MKPLFHDTSTATAQQATQVPSAAMQGLSSVSTQPVVLDKSATLPADVSTLQLSVTDDYIDRLGTDATNRIPTLSSQIAEKAKASQMDDFGVKVGDLISTAKGWDVESSAGGIIGRVKSFLGRTKEDMKDHYHSVETRVNQLVTELRKIADGQRRAFTDLQNMIVEAGRNYQAMSAAIEDGQARLEELRRTLKALQDAPQDGPEYQRAIQAAKRLETRLDRRIRDLDAARTVAMQSAVMMEGMSSTAIGIVDKFESVDKISISIWRDQFTIYLMSLDQERAANVFDKVDEATNASLQKNAARVRQTAVRIEQANNRGSITRETIAKVNEEMIGMLSDLRKENDEAAKRRKEDMAEFEKRRDELSRAVREFNKH